MINRYFYFVAIAVLLLWSGFSLQSGRFRIGSTTINDSTTAYTTLNKGLYVGGGDAYVRDSVNSGQVNTDLIHLNALSSAIIFQNTYESQIFQGINSLNYWQRKHNFKTRYGNNIMTADSTDGVVLNGVTKIWTGSGSPESVVTAPVGSIWLRTDGSTSTTLYVKTSGSSNTGWTAK